MATPATTAALTNPAAPVTASVASPAAAAPVVSAASSTTNTTHPTVSPNPVVSKANSTNITSTHPSATSTTTSSTSQNQHATQQQSSTTTQATAAPAISSNNNTIVTNSAHAARTSNNNHHVNGSSDHSRASTDGHRTPNVDALSKTNIYIKGLQPNTSDQDLYNMCCRFGHISSTKAIIEKSTGCCKGYGFVELSTPQAAELAVQELTKSGVQAQMARITPLYSFHHSNNNHHHHQHHHHVNQRNHHHHNHNVSSSSGSAGGGSNSGSSGGVGPNAGGGGSGGGERSGAGGHHNNNNNNGGTSQHNQSSSSSSTNATNNNNNPDPTNLYIANLPPDMSEQELENLLSKYGSVVSTRILRDQTTNQPRGVGFARMESRDKCEQIIEQLNGNFAHGWKDPLLVKFADGGNRKPRNHHTNQHHHNNGNHHRPQKVHQDDNRWRDNNSAVDLGSLTSYDQSNISHSNHIPDLAMMGSIGYPRMQPAFPPAVPPDGAYPGSLGPQSGAPQWIHHPAGPGQPYVIPQQMIQAGGLAPSNPAAAASALHYGHIPQLTSQMQGLQIAHPVGGYLPPQQWSPIWPQLSHMPQQTPQPQVRLANSMQQQQQQQPQPPHIAPGPQPLQPPQSTQAQQQAQSAPDNKIQVSMPL